MKTLIAKFSLPLILATSLLPTLSFAKIQITTSPQNPNSFTLNLDKDDAEFWYTHLKVTEDAHLKTVSYHTGNRNYDPLVHQDVLDYAVKSYSTADNSFGIRCTKTSYEGYAIVYGGLNYGYVCQGGMTLTDEEAKNSYSTVSHAVQGQAAADLAHTIDFSFIQFGDWKTDGSPKSTYLACHTQNGAIDLCNIEVNNHLAEQEEKAQQAPR